MADVTFRVVRAEAASFSASPQIVLHVEVRAGSPDDRVQSILLRSATRIEAGARTHSLEERARLEELFGDEGVWARSSRSLLWGQVAVVVPGFQGTTTIEVHLPCSYDLGAAAAKYLHGLTEGEVPITVQFSGTLFRETSEGLTVSQIPWDREAPFRVPLAVWQRVLDEHFPNSAVVSVRRDLFERVDRYRLEHGLLRWEEAVNRLLDIAEPQAVELERSAE